MITRRKNADITTATASIFNEVSMQKNESKRLGYFFTIPKKYKQMNIKFMKKYHGYLKTPESLKMQHNKKENLMR